LWRGLGLKHRGKQTNQQPHDSTQMQLESTIHKVTHFGQRKSIDADIRRQFDEITD